MMYTCFGEYDPMKLKLIFLTTAILLTQLWAYSKQQDNPGRVAKPDEIPFVYDKNVFGKVEIQSFPKAVAEELQGFPEDAPAHSCFNLEDKRPLPALERGPRYFYPTFSSICIIPLTDNSVPSFAKAYPNVNDAAVKLRKLLKTHPRRFKFYDDLSELPYNNARGAIQSRVQYLSFKNGTGLLFLTQYTQENEGNPINNEELTCSFQGLTTDGKYYVGARFALTHPSLPKGIDSTSHIKRDKNHRYLKTQERLLNGYAEDSFQPSLKTLKSLISSISVK